MFTETLRVKIIDIEPLQLSKVTDAQCRIMTEDNQGRVAGVWFDRLVVRAEFL